MSIAFEKLLERKNLQYNNRSSHNICWYYVAIWPGQKIDRFRLTDLSCIHTVKLQNEKYANKEKRVQTENMYDLYMIRLKHLIKSLQSVRSGFYPIK